MMNANPNISVAGNLGKPTRRAIGLILGGCAVMFLILQGGMTWLTGKIDATWLVLQITAVMLVAAIICERWLFRLNTGQALLALGYDRPYPRAILAAGMITCLMLAFFPVFTLATGIPFSLKSDWLWILLSIVILNGLGEETLFRGYVFGNLRKVGFSFTRAGFISMVIFAAVHLFLFVQNPFIFGLLGTLVAVAAAFPMAYLFERGHNTIWAPMLLHVAAHAIRLVDMPGASYMTVVTVWLVLQLAIPFLVLALRGSLMKPQVGPAAVA
jgi:membrane protease YdiL (CAAX protease family)